MDHVPENSNVKQKHPFSVTHSMVIGLALPMTLAYMTTPLLGLVDTAVVGRLGSAALLGGLAVGAVIIDMVFTTFNFLRSGTTGLTAQALGRSDEKEQQAILFRAILIALISGLLLVAAIPLTLWIGIFFIEPSKEVAQVTSKYFTIRMIGTPFALMNYAILGWLIGLGRSGLGLMVQIILNGTNIILSILLGLVYGYGLEGVATATIIGELTACIIGGAICWRLLSPSTRPSKQRIFEKNAILKFANLNADIMVRSFVLVFAFAYFTSQATGFGEVTLAANAVLMNLFLISGYFLDGLATAAEQITGRAIGANYKPAFWRGIHLTAFWNLALAATLTLTFIVFGEQLINLITTLQPVRSTAYEYLWFAAFTAVTGVLAFQMDGVFIGATWSREMSIMMIVSLIAYLAGWQLLRDYGNTGLWIALHIFLIIRGISLTIRLPIKAKAVFID